MSDSHDGGLHVQSADAIVQKVAIGGPDAIIPPPTSTYSKPVVIIQLPLDSLSRREANRMHEKNGYESPSTVSLTSFSSDLDQLPVPPLHNHDVVWGWKQEEYSDDGTSEHLRMVSLYYDHHARVIQATVRRSLIREQLSSSKWAKQRENEKNRCNVAATKIQAFVRSWHVSKLTLLKMEKQRAEQLHRQTNPSMWVKQRENEKNRRHAAAIRIQSFFRAWRADMLSSIDKMEKRLERAQLRSAYALQWAERLKKRDMERIKRDMVSHREIDQHVVERELSKTLKVIEGIRTKNRQLRMSNQDLAHVNDARRKENQKLRSENTSIHKKMTLITARIPRLKAENQTLRESDIELESSVRNFRRSWQQVNDFWEFESKTNASTRDTIVKILSLVKEVCTEDEIAKTIMEVGMANLERNDEHAKHLLKEARKKTFPEKTARDEGNEGRYEKVDRAPRGLPDIELPSNEMVKKSPQKHQAKMETSGTGHQSGRATEPDRLAKLLGSVDTKSTATAPVKSQLGGVKKTLESQAPKEKSVTVQPSCKTKPQLDEAKRSRLRKGSKPPPSEDLVHRYSTAKQAYHAKNQVQNNKSKKTGTTNPRSFKTKAQRDKVNSTYVRQSWGPHHKEDKTHMNAKKKTGIARPSHRVRMSIRPTSSKVATIPSVKKVLRCGMGASGLSRMQKTDGILTKTPLQNGRGVSNETQRKTFKSSGRTNQKITPDESACSRMKRIPVKNQSPGRSSARPIKSMVVKRVEQIAENAAEVIGERPTKIWKTSTKVTNV